MSVSTLRHIENSLVELDTTELRMLRATVDDLLLVGGTSDA